MQPIHLAYLSKLIHLLDIDMISCQKILFRTSGAIGINTLPVLLQRTWLPLQSMSRYVLDPWRLTGMMNG